MALNVMKFSGAIKVGSLAADPSSPENGMIYYNSTDGIFRKYEGGAWSDMSSADAEGITYDNGSSGLTATNVQDAIDELDGRLDDTESDISDNTTDIADLVTLSGVAANSTHLGTFTGSTIPDSQTNKQAFQALETAVETKANDNIVIKKDGSVAFTAAQSMGGFKLTNLATPTAGTDAVTKSYADGIAAGLDPKKSVRAATTAALPTSTYDNGTAGVGATLTCDTDGEIPAQDGTTLALNDRLLVKNQADPLENGIYTVTQLGDVDDPFILTRATDQDGSPSSEVSGGNFTFVETGTAHEGDGFVVIFDGDIEVGTDDIEWTQFSESGASAVSSVNGETGAVVLDSSEIDHTQADPADWTVADESSIAAHLDELAMRTTDIEEAGYISSLLEDTTPELGGDLDLNDESLMGKMRRSAISDAANFVEEEYIHATTLTASTTAVASAFTFAHATFEGTELTYKIKEATSNKIRIGRLRVVTNGTDLSFTDDYTETADVGVSWAVAINGANVELSYTTTANAKTMRADVKRIKA